ncbi:glycosyltransferase family protein [Sulfitobacter guttiformis]|uniref:Putative glycosyltransferase n=1 Tax=Sulfitobacter guttiformis TaxID=74349 RepID=A0A420DU01_9RHOB|nr:membrane protein [Sulfitobacter guttiformis]KIN71181.1 Membrane-anchored protein [Sulfitobacter guttiformis KCTC 32187]RKE97653.1 putative glycosyltransferase [Sulfitobacter guttiformis]
MSQEAIAKLNARAPSRRVMLYSHDTFGLGHLRRSRALATALTAGDPDASAIILTGSPVAGRFTFPERVDHIRLPGVTKLPDGSYVSSTLGLNIDATTNLRAGLIQSAVEQYRPDLLIVDKEPTGFRGELLPTLEWLQSKGECRVVLGLRDVLDEPEVLATEWERKGAVKAAEAYYDEFWVYGVEDIYDPTKGLPFSDATRARMHYTGYLRRTLTDSSDVPNEPYILITPGGGGDGAAMVSLVLDAYEADPDLGPHAMLVYGPFLSGDVRDAMDARVAALGGRVTATGFDSRIEALFAQAQGVVCMGGYNTFCEVLSFDQRAVIVPRTVPRLEQWIRASRAEELGLVRMLDDGRDGMTVAAMIKAIRDLPTQQKPSAAGADGLLDGLDVVVARGRALMAQKDE